MATNKFLFSAELTNAERDKIREALEQHSVQRAPGLNARPVEIALRSGSGRLVGGLLGSTAWDWLLIDLLWLDDVCRGHGLGSGLLAQAERKAIDMGCTHARAETFDFQALPFYERHGYDVYARLEGFPKGHTEYQLRKKLS